MSPSSPGSQHPPSLTGGQGERHTSFFTTLDHKWHLYAQIPGVGSLPGALPRDSPTLCQGEQKVGEGASGPCHPSFRESPGGTGDDVGKVPDTPGGSDQERDFEVETECLAAVVSIVTIIIIVISYCLYFAL